MAVVGSNITIDVHITADTDRETVRGALRNQNQVHPKLTQDLRRTIERKTTLNLQEEEITAFEVGVDVHLVTDRVPGAPRERIIAELNVRGENEVLAAVEDAVSTPTRARLADAVEDAVAEYLAQHNLSGQVPVTVSVTPIQFR